jgi:hypothetical protein
MLMTSQILVARDDYVSDITVQVGLALREQLIAAFPGRVRERDRDSPLSIVPGRSTFIPQGAFDVDDTASTILPALIREITHQAGCAGIDLDSDRWTVSFAWDGHGLFHDGQFVEDGFRFDAYIELFAR